MRGLIILLVLLFFSCNSVPSDRIIVPEFQTDFYSGALERIDKELRSKPEDQHLVAQKIFYCEELDWPLSCIEALDTYRSKNGMTNQLVEQYVSYYKAHEMYESLLNVIDKWSEEYDLEERYKETYIDALTRLNRTRPATIELREYLKRNQSKEAISFASEQFLRINDTTMAAYNLGKLYTMDQENDLMWEYGKILISLGYINLGFDRLSEYVNSHDDFDTQIVYAKMLENAERSVDSRRILKSWADEDTVAYMISDSFQKDFLWDSAAMVLQEISARDSLNRKPLWKLGRLYEDRGWFLSAIPYFEYLLELDPSDTLASKRIGLIQRKIAYLQRQKFEENKIPVIEVKPKKIDN